MAQHALGGEDHERFAPVPQALAAQQVEILRGIRGLANLEIVASRELQETFNARARVLRSLTFITMRQKQNQPREQSPLVFAGADELIDDRLGDVGEVPELCFPQY